MEKHKKETKRWIWFDLQSNSRFENESEDDDALKVRRNAGKEEKISVQMESGAFFFQDLAEEKLITRKKKKLNKGVTKK